MPPRGSPAGPQPRERSSRRPQEAAGASPEATAPSVPSPHAAERNREPRADAHAATSGAATSGTATSGAATSGAATGGAATGGAATGGAATGGAATPTIRRGGLPLRWRFAALAALAIALLGIIATAAAFLVVRSSLRGDLQRVLRRDVLKVAELYAAGAQGEVRASLAGPTGAVIVQLYDPQGRLFVASLSTFETPEAAIPAEIVAAAREGPRDWSGTLAGRSVQAALAPFDLGVVAVVAETAYIGAALTRLARALLVTALLLVLASALLGYLVAAAAIRPITDLARAAATLGPNRLEPIHDDGPRDEVAQLSSVLNELIARLKAALDAQRSFLAETSHELRTPLTSLQGFLERALRRANPEVQRDLQDARRIAQSMSRLVADLLQLSRGQLVEEMTPHLVDPFHEVVAPIAEEFPGVRVEGRPGSLLLGDPERLRQLLRNLTANAVRAAGTAESVTLALREHGSSVQLCVHDEGPGIPAEVLPRIFEKFYKGPGGGSGLGLAIARQIAEHHGGRIEVRSVPGDTEFIVTLPAVELPE